MEDEERESEKAEDEEEEEENEDSSDSSVESDLVRGQGWAGMGKGNLTRHFRRLRR